MGAFPTRLWHLLQCSQYVAHHHEKDHHLFIARVLGPGIVSFIHYLCSLNRCAVRGSVVKIILQIRKLRLSEIVYNFVKDYTIYH